MAKGRKLKKISNKTTELLDIDELKAISFGDYVIVTEISKETYRIIEEKSQTTKVIWLDIIHEAF